MRNQKLLTLFYLLFISLTSNAQSISDLSLKICDSIEKHKYSETDTISLKQAEIYSKFIGKYYLENTQKQLKNFKSDFNSLNYKLTRELDKTCKSFKIKNSYILPFSNLIEIDSVFSIVERENIEKLSNEIRYKNRMEILILSIDDLYPYKNIDEFAYNKLIDWNVGGIFEKSGVIIVFSKKMRLLRITTTQISKKYLTDLNCEKIISGIMIPNFKKDNYYEGIVNSLYEIKEITK